MNQITLPEPVALPTPAAGTRLRHRLRDALRRTPRWLRGMSWTRVGWLFAVALGFGAYGVLGEIIRNGAWGNWRDFVLVFSFWSVRYLVDFAPILLTLTVADNLPLTGALRIAALTVALVVGAQFQWPILCASQPESESACDEFPAFLWRSWTEMLGENTVWAIGYSTPIVLVYFYRRRDQHLAKALHNAEIARTELQRRTLEADLHTMQARVEPGFLFETLGDIGELFDREPGAGARMLDELIRYLRAALPDTGAAGSTLRQEAALARAYLAILQIRSEGRLAFDVRIPEALLGIEMPPMMLLPLLAAGIGPATVRDVASSVHVDALLDAGRVRLVITGRGPALRAAADAPVVQDIRERLRTIYGDRATLRVDAEPGRRVTAVLELPDTAADADG